MTDHWRWAGFAHDFHILSTPTPIPPGNTHRTSMNLTPTPRFLCLMLGAFALACGTLPAAVLIDDFSLDSSIVINAGGSPIPESDAQTVMIEGQAATRTFSGGADSGQFQVQIRENAFGYASLPGSTGNASLGYNGFSVDLTATPFLRMDFSGISGTGSFVVELQSSVSPFTVGHLPITLNSSTPSSLFLDVRQFAAYQEGVLTGVNAFLFAVEGVGEPPFFMQLSRISFTTSEELLGAIPEPASAAWVAAALLGAGAMLRGRRKASRDSVSR